jgi:hypothetical protein
MTLRGFGLGIVRRWPWADGFGRRLYSLVAVRLRVTVIEIGASLEILFRPLILANPQCSSRLAEPQPDIFARLRKNYQGQAHRLEFLNAADCFWRLMHRATGTRLARSRMGHRRSA